MNKPSHNRKLGSSELRVSPIGLGCNTFGAACDKEQAAAVVHAALDLGINFFDTAEAYSDGVSESYLGAALKGRRDDVILATKTGVITDPTPRLTRAKIIERLNASLRRLETDHVDLYYLHFPDPTTPLTESLEAMDDMVTAGKVRHVAVSNFPGTQIDEIQTLCRDNAWSAPVVSQSLYNLMDRTIETAAIPALDRAGMSLVAHSALAGGFLTGKYQRNQVPPPGTRGHIDPANTNRSVVYGQRWQDRWLTSDNFDKLESYQAVAVDLDWPVSDLAIAWILANPTVCSVIAGARTPEQVAQNVASGALTLPRVAIDALI